MATWTVRTSRSGFFSNGEIMLSVRSLIELRENFKAEGATKEAKFVNEIIRCAMENDARS